MRVVLVEGESDRVAVETLAARLGRDELRVVPMGGATNIRRFLARAGPDVVAGLCDAREAALFRRALDGRGECFVCTQDLEDELIRAVGVARVLELVGEAGEHRALRSFQRQPAQQDRPVEAQLRRFMGTKSGRKARYARLLAEAVELESMPTPLADLLALPAGGQPSRSSMTDS